MLLLALFSCDSPQSAAPGADDKTTPVTVPAAPGGLTADAGNGEATIRWEASTGAVSYELRYTTADPFVWETAISVPGVTSGHKLTSLTNGTTYRVAVRASNSAGTSPSSAVVTAEPRAALPTSPTVTPGDAGTGRISFSWTPVDGATTYNVYVVAPGETPASKAPVVQTGTDYTATGLTDSQIYRLYVRAVNAAGPSALSDEVTMAPVPQFGTPNALNGTWSWDEPRSTGAVTYTATVTQVFNGSSYLLKQVSHDFSDNRASATVWRKGTAAYRTFDLSVVVTLTDEGTDGTTWSPLTPPIVTVYRNLIFSGSWHPDAWWRTTVGPGFSGPWRTVGEQSEADPAKFNLVEYTVPASGNTIGIKGFEFGDESTLTELGSGTDTVTWDGSTLSLVETGVSFQFTKLNNQWADVGDALAPARVGAIASPLSE